jgi:putative redox protein
LLHEVGERKMDATDADDKESAMNVRVKLVEGVTWLASGDSGHGVTVDGAPAIGGRNLGPRPMELVLMGLGGCTAMDVITTLRKMRQDVTDCEIEVSAQRAESPPRVFTEVHLRYRVTGRKLKSSAVERAVNLSRETYCSVSKMLERAAVITHDIEMIEAG